MFNVTANPSSRYCEVFIHSAHGSVGCHINIPHSAISCSDQCSTTGVIRRKEEMFYLATHTTHFIYGYMVSDIW